MSPTSLQRLVLADTGIRASELVGLRLSDLMERGKDRFILVSGKSARERLVPVQPQLHRRLQRLARGRPDDADGGSSLPFLEVRAACTAG
jgi:integrase